MGPRIPPDKINLRLIIVTGKTKDLLCKPADTAAHICDNIFEGWPEDWEEEHKPESNILRLIYQGRFLHGNVTLQALNLPLGKTVVMHLVPRETLPEPNSNNNKKEKVETAGTCSCCTIS